MADHLLPLQFLVVYMMAPIREAKIYIDVNDNGKIDKDIDLLIDTTDSNGAYDIPIAHKDKNLIADLTGAIDTLDQSNTPLSGEYHAPAGSKVISPLTHYLSKGGDVTILENLTSDEIKTRDPFDGQANDDIDNRIKTLAKIVATELGDDDNFDNADALNINTLETAITAGITSANDAPTAMNLSRSSHVVAENTATKTHLATITFTDADGLGENAITLNNDTLFEIENTSRLVKNLYLKAGQTLDHETNKSIEVTLTGPGTLEETFTLNIGNINDSAPSLARVGNTGDLRIGTPNQDTDTGLTFTLTDADDAVNMDGFKITSTDSVDQSGKFKVVPVNASTDIASGKTYKIQAISGETFTAANAITLTVTYNDGVHAGQSQTFAAFTPSAAFTTPVISGGATASHTIIEDDSKDGDTADDDHTNDIKVTTLTATGGGITWSIDDTSDSTGGADRANFYIDPDNGDLYFIGKSNQDAGDSQATHTVIVTATNTNTDTNTEQEDTQTITLTISNKDEGPAEGITVTGTPRVGQDLGIRVATADPDGTISTTLRYQWYRTDKDDNTSQIQNATNATYRLTTADEDHTISVKITYRDNSVTGQTTDTVVTSTPSAKIPITPVITATDDAPAIDEDETSTSIAVPVVFSLTKDTPVTWSVSDTTNFQINPTTGALTFTGPSDQDASNPSSYDIMITATSRADTNLTDTHNITVTIEDIDDEDPTLTGNDNFANTIHGGSNRQAEYGKRDTGLYVDLVDPDTEIPDDYTPAIAVSINGTPNTAAADAFALERDTTNAPTDGMRYKLVIKPNQRLDSGKTYSFTISQPDATPWAGSITRSATETISFDTEDNTPAVQGGVGLNVRDTNTNGVFDNGDTITATSHLTDRNGIETAHYQFFKFDPNDPSNPVSLGNASITRTYTIQASDSFMTGDKVRVVVTFTDRGRADEISTPATTELGIGDDVIITGTSGDDTLGNASATMPQHIKGLGGADTLNGGSGNDLLNGGAGEDTINGGTGSDTATYADGTIGVTIDLTLNDGTTAQTSAGEASGDILNGIEHIIGSSGNDVIKSNATANNINGGDGNDTVSYERSDANVLVSMLANTSPEHFSGYANDDILTSIENIIGSDNDDTISGSAGNNILDGGDGVDWLTGGGGNDVLKGGAGLDTLDGSLGNDVYVLGARGEGRDNVVFARTNGDMDKIRVDTANGNETTLAALKTAANLRWTNDSDSGVASFFNLGGSGAHDTIIYNTNGGDEILMVLFNFTTDLTIDMFDII